MAGTNNSVQKTDNVPIRKIFINKVKSTVSFNFVAAMFAELS